MVVVKAYADDSRPNNRIWAVGGYAGNDWQWEHFESEWPKILARHEIPYFHMREMADPEGVYKKWHSFKEHYDEVADFFADTTDLINLCGVRPFFSITRVNDMERINAEHQLKLEVYPLAAWGCMLATAKDNEVQRRRLTVEIIFDHVEKISSKLATAVTYAESDLFYPGINEWIVPIPLNNKLTFREVLPLQIADFIIWEVQKNHLNIEEWFTLPNRPLDQEERSLHMDKWSLQKYGTIRPPTRKSLQSLADWGLPPIGIIWDYDNLSETNRLRGGVWS